MFWLLHCEVSDRLCVAFRGPFWEVCIFFHFVKFHLKKYRKDKKEGEKKTKIKKNKEEKKEKKQKRKKRHFGKTLTPKNMKLALKDSLNLKP